MRSDDPLALHSVGMPYAEVMRYVTNIETLQASTAEVSALLLTGEAYE
jgi:hypothetical protein